MYPYSDPTCTPSLEETGALLRYRNLVDSFDTLQARQPGSAYVRRDAFNQLDSSPGQTATVQWKAFPQMAQQLAEADIDARRIERQDEYIEWIVKRGSSGEIETVTFTTEFADYFRVLAETGLEALKTGIKSIFSNAQPTSDELFGHDFDAHNASDKERGRAFWAQLPTNPYNNGEHGILCLTHPSNTLGALFGLIGPCAIVRTDLPSSGVCSALGRGCVPGRNSDPFVCAAAQDLARGGNGLTLDDPVGIQILTHQGSWQRGDKFFDINDPIQAGDSWGVSRGRHRAVLNARGLRLEGEPVQSGAQIARQLMVGARVLWAPENTLPAWARTNNESSRIIA